MANRQGARGARVLASGLAAALAALVAGPAGGQTAHDPHQSGNYGQVRFPVTCAAESQAKFETAVALLHSFFYPETQRAFTALTVSDPGCAMAWWGVAISQRPNPLISPFPPELLRNGWQAIEQARAAGPRSERERDWIEALAIFFQDYERVDQPTRTLAYEAAMERLAARYPDDDEAQIFHALAINEAIDLNDKTYARQLRAAAILEGVQARQPNHPGVAHYLIHSYDYAPLAERGLPAARRYAALAPSAPHALHMPSHTFSTLGLWAEAIPADLASDARRVAYTAEVNPQLARTPVADPGRYHSFDFLANAYLQLAQEAPVRQMVAGLREVGDPAPASLALHTGFVAVPVRYAFERSAWSEAAALWVPRTSYPQAEAITWFGRAIGAARSGDAPAATAHIAQIRAQREKLAAANQGYWAGQVEIQERAAEAWASLAQGRNEEALRLMRVAADLEDRSEKHVAMENRLSPMRELLGEMLLQTGDTAAAVQAFEASLQVNPNRYRSFAGAASAAERSGDRAVARRHYEALLRLTADADTQRPEMEAARRFLAASAN